MTLQLFAGTASTCSLAPHIALEEAKADYDVIRLDFSKGEQRSPEYLKVNPKGRVPALATPQGIITENPAILLYIAQTHPEARLAPLDDAFRLGKLQAFTSYLCSTVHPAHAHRLRGSRWSDEPAVIEALKIKVPHNMAECFSLIENEYLEGPWVLGNDYSIADPYLFIISTWLEADGVDVNRFPRVKDHRERMAERPAVKAVLASYA